MADRAHKLKVSRGAVTKRLHTLEDQQAIVGYTVRLRPESDPERISAWMGILVEGKQTRRMSASLHGEPGVAWLHDTHGRRGLLAELEAGSMPRPISTSRPTAERAPEKPKAGTGLALVLDELAIGRQNNQIWQKSPTKTHIVGERNP